jgi:tetratricopeptide (TPR) repeat protein
MVKNQCLIFLCLMLFGCSTNSVLEIKTQEEARIQLYRAGEMIQEDRGKLNLNLSGLLSQNESLLARITHKDYQTSTVLIPHTKFRESFSVQVELEKLNAAYDENQTKLSITEALSANRINLMVKDLIHYQNNINNNRVNDGFRIAQKLISEYPGIGIFHDLAGNALLMQSNYSSALSFYEKAQELGPPNQERESIIRDLRGR